MKDIKRIAVFTSGGDSPGMNAAIRSVVRTGSYHGYHIFGIYNGYRGMINGNIKRLETKDVANIIQTGGTILRTARSKEFMTKEGRKAAYESLLAHRIDACIAIGGNGTYTGADIFSKEYGIPFIGIPGTIDNDIFGTDSTIGFDTAINTAVDAMDRIRDTAHSHAREFFVEVMGRKSGYIALHTAIASGAGRVFLPETDIKIDELVDFLHASTKRGKLFNLIIVAEGNKNGNAMEIAEKVKKIDPSIETRVTIIGHLQRGGSPSAFDRVLASRFGYAAINAIVANKFNIAIGITDNNISHNSFKDAISKSKSLNTDLLEMAKILAM